MSFSESTVQSETYNLYVDMNDADYTDAEINTPTETIIWDRIKILTLNADDSRIDINTVGTWYATSELEYDSDALGVGDSFTLSTYSFTWNGTYFTSTDNEATTQQHIINAFDNGNEATYGITVGNINGQSQDIIWDRLIITFSVDDNTPLPNTDATFTVDIEYEYDSVNCTTYIYDIQRNATLYKDDYAFRRFTDNQPEPTKYVYDFEGASETLYGLTAYLDDDDITVQWLSLIIIGDVNLLFGVGYNHTTPYVYIMWNYSGSVDNYEIYHSIDNITYSSLALTPNKYYNHTSLINGSYHYYKVRSTYNDGVWQNSSFSPINLERVWFIRGGGGVIGSTIGIFNNFIIVGFLSVIAVVGNKVRRMR